MHAITRLDYSKKADFYRELNSELEGICAESWLANLANASALLMAHLPRVNWAGFYLLEKENLYLGPFQGLPACLQIPLGRGVCGQAARARETVLVGDVTKFEGHIACDSRSRSEIVIPLFDGERVVGVLDIDSEEFNRFEREDQAGLEEVARILSQHTRWPENFNL